MKPAVIGYAALGAAIQVASLAAFIGFGASALPQPGKALAITLLAGGSALLYWHASRRPGARWLVVLSLVLGIGMGIAIQALGRTAFPGLVKDVALLSWDNLRNFAGIVILSSAAYVALAGIVTKVRKLRERERG
jgi:hypothetical protein